MRSIGWQVERRVPLPLLTTKACKQNPWKQRCKPTRLTMNTSPTRPAGAALIPAAAAVNQNTSTSSRDAKKNKKRKKPSQTSKSKNKTAKAKPAAKSKHAKQKATKKTAKLAPEKLKTNAASSSAAPIPSTQRKRFVAACAFTFLSVYVLFFCV